MRPLSRAEQAALAAGALVLLGVAVYYGQALEGAYRVQGAVEGVTRTWAYPPGHQHLAHPDEIGDVLWGPHPVYCDPMGPGRFRDPLIGRGWEFLADPPQDKII